MGELIVSDDPNAELVALGLGSCIGLVMVDRQAGVAGLAHVVLPDSASGPGPEAKFADTAVPELIDQMTALGAKRVRLEVAIAGGASMFGNSEQLDIGARNTAAVRAALATARLRCTSAEVGGDQGRTVRVDVGAGTATVRVAGGQPAPLLSGRRRLSEVV